MRKALVSTLVLCGCSFSLGQGTGSVTPVIDDAGPGGSTRPRLGEQNPAFARPGGLGEEDLAPLRVELGHLEAAQKQFHGAHGQYAHDLESLDSAVGYRPAGGIQVSITYADANGFAAIATRGLAECGIFVGDVDPPADFVRASGVVGCDGA